MKRKAIIVDIDGTLANVDHRLKYLTAPKVRGLKKAFHDRLHLDTPNEWCKKIIELFIAEGTTVILLTCRPIIYKSQTFDWLRTNNIEYDILYMRPLDDSRPDCVIKKELYNNCIKEYYDVSFILEDRKAVVQMWRKLGLVCLQCEKGEF